MARHIFAWVIAFVALTSVAIAAEPLTATVTVDAAAEKRDVPPLWLGQNVEWVWQGQHLFNTDGTGAKPGVAALIRSLHPGLIRYPGGSLSNTFRFADSLGPLAERKPIANFFTLRGPYTKKMAYDTERPLLGFDDHLKFVADTGAKGAMVTVNCTWWPENPELSGTAQEAAAWVAYANARVGDPAVKLGADRRGADWRDSQYWAALRAKNGHPEPYGVTHWEIGNEVYTRDQGAGMTAQEYGDRVFEFAGLMKSVDPTIRIGGVLLWDNGRWNEEVIKAAAREKERVDFLILHFYPGGTYMLTRWLGLHDLGPREAPFTADKAGKYQIIIEAAGRPIGTSWPEMKVALDGKPLGEAVPEVNFYKDERKEFPFPCTLDAGEHVVRITCPNDQTERGRGYRELFVTKLFVQPEGGERRAIDLDTMDHFMVKLAGTAEMYWPRCLAGLDKQQTKYGVSLPYEVTEYGCIWGNDTKALQKSRDLKSALAVGYLAQRFLEDPRIEGAEYWCIKSAWFLAVEEGPKGWRLAPGGVVFRTLAPLAEGKVVATQCEGPSFRGAWVYADYPLPWVHAVAVKRDGQLAVSLLNWRPDRAAKVTLRLKGVQLAEPKADTLALVGPGPNAVNEDGKPAVIRLEEGAVDAGETTAIDLAPCSMATVIFKTQ